MVFGLFKKKRSESGVIDLGKLNEIQERERLLKEATITAKEQVESNTGFLGTLATAGSEHKPVAISGQDIEKFERLNRRLDHLIDRLELLERKIERIERRVDLKY